MASGQNLQPFPAHRGPLLSFIPQPGGPLCVTKALLPSLAPSPFTQLLVLQGQAEMTPPLEIGAPSGAHHTPCGPFSWLPGLIYGSRSKPLSPRAWLCAQHIRHLLQCSLSDCKNDYINGLHGQHFNCCSQELAGKGSRGNLSIAQSTSVYTTGRMAGRKGTEQCNKRCHLQTRK